MSAEWGSYKLADLIKIKHGFAFSGKHITDKESAWQLVTPGNFRIGGGFKSGGKKFWAGEVPNDYILRKGDLIVTMTDLSKEGDTLGFSALVPDSDKWLHNQRIGLVNITRPDLISKEYLYFLLRTPEYRAEIMGSATGSTVKHTSPNRICDFNFRLPPLDEQKRICKTLSGIENLADSLEASNIILEPLALTLFKSWFVNFDPVHAKAAGREPEGLSTELAALFPSEFEESELGLIPKGWQVSKLGENCRIFDNLRKPLSGREREKMPGSIPYYGATSVMDYIDEYIFDGEYLLLGEDGSVAKEDGTPFLQYIWGKTWVNNHAHVLRGANGFSTEALYIALLKADVTPFVTGAVQLKINQANLKQIPLIKPSLQVINEFNKLVNSTFACSRNNTEQIRCLESLRDELLPRLISGKIQIEEAEEALESVLPTQEKKVA